MASSVQTSNLLGLSWHDPIMAPHLNKDNVLDYFSQRSNRFYDCTCNNEILKMQSRSLQYLQEMNGVEYILLHCQDPILYVIRKQKRSSPKQVQTLADYYIIAGTVYQSPDIGSVINSRLMTTLHHLDSAFKEALSNSRYHPAKGYSWKWEEESSSDQTNKRLNGGREETPASGFHYSRVDALLANISTKFPFAFIKAESNDQSQLSVRKNEKPVEEKTPKASNPRKS